MGNLTFVLIIFWPYIVSNLSVVSILLSNGKPNRCFNTFLALHCRQSFRRSIPFSNRKSHRCFNNCLAFDCRQSICCFNPFGKRNISPLFQRVFGFVLLPVNPLFQFFIQMENLTVFSTLFCRCIVGNQSVVLVLFSKEKSNRCCKNFLALHCNQSIHCFISFVTWKF